MKLKKKHLAALAILLVAACGSVSVIVSLIAVAVSSAEVAASATGNLPPDYVPDISAALDGLNCAATEGASTDTPAVMATKIRACLVTIVLPVLGADASPQTVLAIQELSAAIAAVVAALPPPAALAAAGTGRVRLQGSVPATKDLAMLLSLSKRVRAAKAKMLAKHLAAVIDELAFAVLTSNEMPLIQHDGLA